MKKYHLFAGFNGRGAGLDDYVQSYETLEQAEARGNGLLTQAFWPFDWYQVAETRGDGSLWRARERYNDQ